MTGSRRRADDARRPITAQTPEIAVVCTPTHTHVGAIVAWAERRLRRVARQCPTSWLGEVDDLLCADRPFAAGGLPSRRLRHPPYAARCRGPRRVRRSDRWRCSGRLASLRELLEPLRLDRQTNHCLRPVVEGVVANALARAWPRPCSWPARRLLATSPRSTSASIGCDENLGAWLHDRARSARQPGPHVVRVRPDSAAHGRPRTHRTGSV